MRANLWEAQAKAAFPSVVQALARSEEQQVSNPRPTPDGSPSGHGVKTMKVSDTFQVRC